MTEPETHEPRRFVWPSDYYSAPTPPSVLPRGVTYGCGAASLVVLLLFFIGGALMSAGGMTQFMDMALGMSLGEMRGMYSADVSAPRKKTLETEIETMREHLRTERIPLTGLQPFMQTLQSSISDRRVTGAEAAQLEETARKINASARR